SACTAMPIRWLIGGLPPRLRISSRSSADRHLSRSSRSGTTDDRRENVSAASLLQATRALISERLSDPPEGKPAAMGPAPANRYTEERAVNQSTLRRVFDWLFRDRRTGKVVIAQLPNLALSLFLVAIAIRWL